MVIYWDAAAAFDLVADYLLLRVTQRLAGRQQRGARLFLAAAIGAAYTVARLWLPLGVPGALCALAAMGATAFGGTGRAVKLTALFAALGCTAAGATLALGEAVGSAARLARGVLTAELPWGVFFAAGAACYLLLGVCMRGGARVDRAHLSRVTLRRAGRSVTVTLLRDSGNTLCDAETGLGIAVIGESAIKSLMPTADKDFSLQDYSSIGTVRGTLRTFVCESVCVDGRELGARRVAIAPGLFGDSGYQGLLPAEEAMRSA